MTDKNIQVKEAQIYTLRELAEKETAWLEKNRLLYTEKKVRLEKLIEERSLNDVEITLEEQELSESILLYESRRSGMWDLAAEINREEQCLTELKSGNQNRA